MNKNEAYIKIITAARNLFDEYDWDPPENCEDCKFNNLDFPCPCTVWGGMDDLIDYLTEEGEIKEEIKPE